MAEPPLRQGTIVQAFIVPPRGKAKWRPAVVYTPDAELATSSTVDLVGISGRYYPDNPDHVRLPWQEDGRGPTRLRKPSAITLALTVTVSRAAVRPTWAYVPESAMAELLLKLKERGRR